MAKILFWRENFMKKMKWLALLAVLVLGLSVFAACGGSADTCKVTYFDADAKTVLKEIKVDKGEKAENWTPEKEGWTFLGWYATPSLKRPFPFDDPVNAFCSVNLEKSTLRPSIRTGVPVFIRPTSNPNSFN